MCFLLVLYFAPFLLFMTDKFVPRIQDVIFGSEGTAQADFERMEAINAEIGLTQLLRGDGDGSGSGGPGKVDAAANSGGEKEAGKHEHKEV